MTRQDYRGNVVAPRAPAAWLMSLFASATLWITGQLALWGALALVLLVALWVAWIWLRKWYFGGAANNSREGLWTLQDLRQMRERGEITEDEYQTLRQQTIGAYQDKGQEPVDQ